MLKRVTEPLGPFPGTGPMPSLQDDLTRREEPRGREWEGPGAAGVSSCASAPAPPERAPAPQLPSSWGRGTTRAQLVHVCERRARTRSQFLLPCSGSHSLLREGTRPEPEETATRVCEGDRSLRKPGSDPEAQLISHCSSGPPLAEAQGKRP